MADFADLAAESIGDRYRGGIKVYLESEDDVAIIGSKWFFALKDRISFESAGAGTPDNSGGCQLVRQRVSEARAQGLDAYGIVDRDILLADPSFQPHFWQTDDGKFAQAKPLGPHIYVLRRWEMENLLLHPRAIAELISNRNLAERKPLQSSISDALIAKEGDLICVTLLSTLTVSKNQVAPKVGFGSHQAGQALEHTVKTHLNCAPNDFDEHRRQIEAFAGDETESLRRWDRLSRLLDGKRVMHRLPFIFTGLAKADMTAERGHLADLIKNLGLVDQMEPGLAAFLQRL
jgi:hypothetical protein